MSSQQNKQNKKQNLWYKNKNRIHLPNLNNQQKTKQHHTHETKRNYNIHEAQTLNDNHTRNNNTKSNNMLIKHNTTNN